MTTKLTQKDLQILRILEKNCKTTNREISKRINSPITTVFGRIKKLEQDGIVKRYSAIVDSEKVERGTTAFVLVQFYFQSNSGISNRERIYNWLSRLNEIQEIHRITGEWNLLLKIKVKDMKAVGDFVLNQLMNMEGLEKTNTLMVLDTKKETTALL